MGAPQSASPPNRPPRYAWRVITYELRPARLREAAHLAAMSESLIETGLRPTWSAARIARHIEHADSVVLVAETAGEILGFAIMQYGDDSAHLNLLAVAPGHRRRGIARALLAWLEETALTAGTFTIGLELRAGNDAAHAFYLALGYRDAGRVPRYYQGVEDAIRMVRDVRIPPPSSGRPLPAHRGAGKG